ncbi:MAG: hypothetical protein CVT64_00110 [Actinobacteria bacterium HGW-Actinobacteria-4]|nr:MAG: hypothetical protein CVT64_00110 [Actinobacteria bacterium HGW-Actinobacteria-4]
MASVKRAPGDVIGGYTVISTLGRGGSGAVYRVTDDAGNESALKLVDASKDPVAAQRLEREVRALQSISHPAVPQVLDAELTGEETFVVFELVPGVSLFQHIQDHGPLTGEELADFAETLASALEAVHASGAVHRDVTPSNIMMGPNGPVLIDFGLSHRDEDARLTRDGLVSGTAGYVAPEVINGREPGPIADRWAWAATVAFAMSGEAPFGSGTGSIGRTLEADPELPDVVGAEALRVALGRDVGARPGMRDVVAALRGATDVLVASAPAATAIMDVEDGGEEFEESQWEEWEVTDGLPDDGEWYDDVVVWRPKRPLMIGVWVIAVSFAAALAPIASIATLVVGSVLARTVYRRTAALQAVRERRGARRSDGVVQTIGLPWHLVRSIGEVIPAVLLAGVLGIGTGALAWWLVTEGELGLVTAEHQAWGHGGALAVGALLVAALMWWGPLMDGTRTGAHRIAGALAPTRAVAAAWVVVAVVAIAVVVLTVYVEVEPWWWPLPNPPA